MNQIGAELVQIETQMVQALKDPDGEELMAVAEGEVVEVS